MLLARQPLAFRDQHWFQSGLTSVALMLSNPGPQGTLAPSSGAPHSSSGYGCPQKRFRYNS
ncbi:hypothetical protein ACRRTK_022132 [Alexandromys fortis]